MRNFEKIPQDKIASAVLENYWRREKELGRHVLAFSIEDIAQTLCREYSCDPDKMRAFILQKTLESPTPDDLKPESLDIILGAMTNAERVYIWTVGDEGAYEDKENHITYPAYNFQRRKIELSGLIAKVKESIKDNAEKSDREPVLSISAENKIEALRKIFTALTQDGVENVYVADDQPRNIHNAEGLRDEFPKLKIHVWWINNASDRGDLAAFKKYIEEQRAHNPGSSRALVLDWDDTIYNESGRMRRMIKNLEEGLS